jgi:hypothetical protein
VPELTETQRHIARHFSNGEYDRNRDIDKQLNPFNENCLVGMIETGEATLDDMQAVGGDVLSARIAKRLTPSKT